MTWFELLLACIRSGQLSAKQIAEELRDSEFARFWKEHL